MVILRHILVDAGITGERILMSLLYEDRLATMSYKAVFKVTF